MRLFNWRISHSATLHSKWRAGMTLINLTDMRLISPPSVCRFLFPAMLWRMPTGEKCLYLTFDDGPHPTITPQVLEILRKYNAKATFFCIGNNVQKYHETFELLWKEGHSVGSHTFNHENGWKTKDDDYVKSVFAANELIHSNLFRPPHGKIRYSQIKKIRIASRSFNSTLLTFNFIAWSVIAYDWDKDLTPEQVYNNVIFNAKDGAIIAFHDSEKAYPRMIEALPKVLDYFTKQGFKFKSIPENLD